MTTADESATFYWRSYSDLTDRPDVHLHPDGYVVVDLGADLNLNVHVHTRAAADTLIKAFTAARDMLPEDETAEAEHACASCGATTDLVPVHDTGGDGAVTWFCANPGECAGRRHAREAVTS